MSSVLFSLVYRRDVVARTRKNVTLSPVVMLVFNSTSTVTKPNTDHMNVVVGSAIVSLASIYLSCHN